MMTDILTKKKPVRLKDRSGVMLIVVLWIVAILSVLIMGISRQASVELALTKHQREKFRTKHAALAGLMYAMAQLQKDSLNSETRTFDTLYQCGIVLEDKQQPEELFRNVPLGDGFFDVKFMKMKDEERQVFFGFEDEESRINVNLLTSQNYQILKYLVIYFGFEEEAADIVAASVVDWVDGDETTFNAPYGAEEDFYSNQSPPRHCKNYAFESVDELRLVKGMTEDIFKKIKDYVTVYPPAGRFQVNMDTASRPVLTALARSLTGSQTNTELEDADGVVEKICDYRKGDDGQLGTADDKIIDVGQLALNSEERIIALKMLQSRTKISSYFRIYVDGGYGSSAVHSNIEAVVFRDNFSIVYWKRS